MKNSELSLKTKKEFSSALKVELKHHPLNKITVTSLLKATNRTRPTFYYHFKDISDLIKWTVQKEVINLLNETKGYDHWDTDILKVLNYFYENQALAKAFYNNLDMYQFNQIFRNPQVKILLGYIDDIISRDKLKICQQDRLLIAKFFTGAFSAIVLDWIAYGQKETPEEIREQLCRTQQDIIIDCLHSTAKNQDMFRNDTVLH
ncbi:TetR/AcrR family transcriptional regulator C-terminal domain-containing protein [Lactobacillus sp. ESL0731]|uniref:TetR/AcrR family transcriptional regulator C-terminal domain-containing protein n=1 Tax=unclassified Lactobacillus TaxID=2620435 RepID=UPI0023F90B11|nr:MULTISPECIES: TetR/AcrR family transcriptional regulator C-terminal domain-containing protein [unclassified Lactobacillus]WEV50390.1 TetR/AcrR family transcriptional regulator C-terminal domain-containing protein [Lactobacillus sp. ESL0700]WEV61520.1 TetR/AcrR family transcriptional regulator C-terminal domain-containing protein [Lactobacillus sp. ESL0731]